jgi:hypothetical protein
MLVAAFPMETPVERLTSGRCMTIAHRASQCLALAMAAAALGSCSSDSGGGGCDPTDPQCADVGPGVVSIEVASPIRTLMAVGRDAQFTASATGPGGDRGTVAFDWSSTDESTATVNSSGRVSAGGAGSTQIRATAGGTTGSLAIQVVNADLAGIERLLDDAFLQSMV